MEPYRETAGELVIVRNRLDALEARLTALDKLLATMIATMDGLSATDATLLDAMKSLANLVAVNAARAELS